jgi:hypothetical protein
MQMAFENYQTIVDDREEIKAKVITKTALFTSAWWETGHPYNEKISRLRVVLKADPGLALKDPVKLFSGNVDLVAGKITTEPGIAAGEGGTCTIDFLFKESFFVKSPNILGYELTPEFQKFFSKLEGAFSLTAMCEKAHSVNYFPELFFSVYLVPDVTCNSDPFLFPLSTTKDRFNIKCRGCITPGFNVRNVKLERVNIGYEDADNNFHPDFPGEKVKAKNPDRRRFMLGDTVNISFTASASDGDAAKAFSFATAGFDFTAAAVNLQGKLFERSRLINGKVVFQQGATIKEINLRAEEEYFIKTGKVYSVGMKKMKMPAGFKFREGDVYTVNLTMVVNKDLKGVSAADPYIGMDEFNVFVLMAKDTVSAILDDGGSNGVADVVKNDPDKRADYFYWCEGGGGRYIGVGTELTSLRSMPGSINRGLMFGGVFPNEVNFGMRNLCDLQVFPTLFQRVGNVKKGDWNNIFSDDITFNAFPNEFRPSIVKIDSIVADHPDPEHFFLKNIGMVNYYKDENAQDGKLRYKIPYSPLPSEGYKNKGDRVVIYPDKVLKERINSLQYPLSEQYEPESVWSDDILFMCAGLRFFNKDPKHFTDTVRLAGYKTRFYLSDSPYNNGKDTVITVDMGQTDGDQLDWTLSLENYYRRIETIKVFSKDVTMESDGMVKVSMGLNVVLPSGRVGVPEYPFLMVSNRSGNVKNVVYENCRLNLKKISIDGTPGIGLNEFWNATDDNQKSKFSLRYDCSSNPLNDKDSVLVYFGWNCYKYPEKLSDACWYDSTWLYFNPVKTGLQTKHYAKENGCKSISYLIKLKATGLGDVNTMEVKINTLSGYIPGDTLYFNYDSLSFPLNQYLLARMVNGEKVWYLDDSNVPDVESFNSSLHNGVLFLKTTVYSKCGVFNATDIGSDIKFSNYCGRIQTISNPFMSLAPLFAGCPGFTAATLTQAPESICEGDKLMIQAKLSPASAGYRYEWQKGTYAGGILKYETIEGVNSLSIVASDVKAGDVYRFSAVSLTTGCISSAILPLNVTESPDAELAVSASEICAGQSVTVTAVKQEGAGYMWYKDGGLIADAVTEKIVVTPEKAAIYRLIAERNGCRDTSDVTVNVLQLPVADAGEDRSICQYGSTMLGGSMLQQGLKYQWTPAGSLSKADVANPVARPGVGETIFKLRVSNGVCSAEDEVKVKVDFMPTPSLKASPEVICAGETVILTVYNQNGVKYKWTANNKELTFTEPEITVHPVVTTKYGISADNNGCKAGSEITVKVNPLPLADAGKDQIICEGDFAVIGSQPVSGTVYFWSPAELFTDNTLSFQKVSPAAGVHVLKVKASDKNCSASDEVTVTVKSSPVADAGEDKLICRGRSVNVGTSAVSGTTYKWSPVTGLETTESAVTSAKPVSSIQYILQAEKEGCTDADTVNVVVSLNRFEVSGPDKVCAGETAVLTASGGSEYSWMKDASIVSQDLSAASIKVKPLVSATYTVNVRDPEGCSEDLSITVEAGEGPFVSIEPQRKICKGEKIRLTANVKCAKPFEGKCRKPENPPLTCGSPLPVRANDLIIIKSGRTYSLDATISNNIRIDAGGTLIICANSVDLSGKLTMNNGGELVIAEGATVFLGNFDIQNQTALVRNYGTMVMGSAGKGVSGNLTVTGKLYNTGIVQAAELNVNSGRGEVENYGTIKVSQNYNTILTRNYGTIEIAGDFKDNGNSTLENYCTMHINKNLHVDKILINEGTIKTGKETIVNSSGRLEARGGSHIVTNSLTVNNTIVNPDEECSLLEVSGTTILNKTPVNGKISFCADAAMIQQTKVKYEINCRCNLYEGGYPGAYAYHWGPEGTFEDPSLDRQEIVAETGKEYTVTITDAEGKTATASVVYETDPACSVDEISDAQSEIGIQVVIYPNPAAGISFVNVRNARSEFVEVEIISQLGIPAGTKIKMKTGENLSLDLRGKTAGTYFIRVTDKETVTHHKLIVE